MKKSSPSDLPGQKGSIWNSWLIRVFMPAPSDLMQATLQNHLRSRAPVGFTKTIFFLLSSPHILCSIIGTEMILRAEHCLRIFSRVTFHISHFLVFLAALEKFQF